LEKEKREKQDTIEEVHLYSEDWQLSQFWYTEETAEYLAKEAILQLQDEPKKRVACICTPSIFIALKKIAPQVEFFLFEFDQRFKSSGSQYIFYDYKNPLSLPPDMRQTVDFAFLDPPFLSEECFTKAAETVRFLMKSPSSKLVVLTGAVLKKLIEDLFANITVSSFKPKHKQLQNDFCCYINYTGGTL